MAVLSLKTELDVAALLLTAGWLPEEINAILVFPLPRAAFHQLGSKIYPLSETDVIRATEVSPTRLCRARQLLKSAGWLERELDSLLKPYLCDDPWANQVIHTGGHTSGLGHGRHLRSSHRAFLPTLSQYRRTMALKRVGSLLAVITFVAVAVVVLG